MDEHDQDRALLNRRKTVLGSAYRLFYNEPVHIVRGEGVWLFDSRGRRYLDLYNNVPHVGHCHPKVVEAICQQAQSLNTHTRYLHENVIEYAEALLARFPDALDSTLFCCTGSEANDLALRMARQVTGGEGVIVTSFAYHGNTRSIYEISTSDIPEAQRPAHVATIPVPDAYRGLYTGDDAGSRYAAHVLQAIEELRARGIRPAALIIDTIASSGGVVELPVGFLNQAVKHVRDAGGLFIADEVQPGFGRTGKHFWGFEAAETVPDIVTLGKPMGNGHPLAGVITRSEFADVFGRNGRYFNTFGGNPVSTAAGLAVLKVLEEERLQQNALEVGAYLRDRLESLAEQEVLIGDVRGTGLFIALELVNDRADKTPATKKAAQLVNLLKGQGVLTGAIGPDANILKLRSPMTLSTEDVDFFMVQLERCLETLAS